ncbi:MAG: MMPL family transporter [Planctomycetes bacterium]|nr:MMPL family transporter [Planctomycetota bacterium]
MKSSFFGRHSLKVLIVAAALLGFSLVGAFRAFRSNKNDVQQWLPDTYTETQNFRWFLKNFSGEQFILASWDGCTLDDPKNRMQLLVEKLTTDDPALKSTGRYAYFDSAMTGPQLLERLTNPPLNLSHVQALERLKGSLIGPDHNQTCVVLTLSKMGCDKASEAVRVVRDCATAECAIPAEKLHMGGPPVDNAALDDAGRASMVRLFGSAMLIGLVISWYCLRSKRLVFMVFASGIYSTTLSMSIVWWVGWYFFGVTMNTVMLTMVSLVYVAAISGAIHLSNYYRDTCVEEGIEGAPGRAIQHAALPLGLATGTTVIGLLTLCYNELVPIQLFGLFSAVGVGSSALVLCLFLPAAFQLFPMRVTDADRERAEAAAKSPGEIGQGPLWRFADWIVEHNKLVTACGLLVLFLGGWGMTKMRTSVELMRMFPDGARIKADYAWLEDHLGELVPMEIVVKLSRDPQVCPLTFLERLELIEKIEDRVTKMPQVGSALSALTFSRDLPKKEDYKSSSGLGGAFTRIAIKDKYKLARDQINKRMSEHREEFVNAGFLTDDGEDSELWRISARVGALKNVDYHEFIDEMKREVEMVVGEPDVQQQAGMEVVYTGLVPVVYKAQRSLFDNLLWGFVMDLITVTIVMTICVREWTAGLVLTLPSIFPMFIVFGVMGWAGILVDTGTVMAPAVALGVTVDDVVHFMLMYRGGLKDGLSRKQSIMVAYQGCARAMYQSWGVIGLGMSVFVLSPFTPTQRFGYMMVTLLTAAMVGNLVVLPAVLVGPIGSLFGRKFIANRRASQPRRDHETVHQSHGAILGSLHHEAGLHSARRGS